jgi:HPt (histidine-containing phosphotransfer) domain-containing protein
MTVGRGRFRRLVGKTIGRKQVIATSLLGALACAVGYAETSKLQRAALLQARESGASAVTTIRRFVRARRRVRGRRRHPRETDAPGADGTLLRRQVHTIKGNCALFGLESVASFCHEIEEHFDEVVGAVSPDARARLRGRQAALGVIGAAATVIGERRDAHRPILARDRRLTGPREVRHGS